MRSVGYLRGPRSDGMDCDRPLLYVCSNGCGDTAIQRCKSGRQSKCGPCSARKRLKVRRIATDGLLSRCAVGYAVGVTITAPGETVGHRQWVVDWDGKSERPVCGCERNLSGGMGLWNASAAKRWNVLRGRLKRLHPEMVFWRGVEIQDGKRCAEGCEGRGAIHYHNLIWTLNRVDVQQFQALVMAAGFGCSIKFVPIKPGDTKAATYASKYVSKSTDQRGQVPWDVVDRETGEVKAVADAPYRTWSASRDWGLTMKVIDEVVRDAARKRAAGLLALVQSDALASAGIGSPVIAGCGPP